MYQPYGQGYQYAPQQIQQPTFQVRGVSSREEAIAAQTDYFSLGTVMPDLTHGVIYVKRFNSNTGSSDFLEFQYVPPADPKQEQFLTIKEFEDFKTALKGDLLAWKETLTGGTQNA